MIWANSFYCYLKSCGIAYQQLSTDPYVILRLGTHNFAVHLVSINNSFCPHDLIALQASYQEKNIQLVHLWEDVWQTKGAQVKARIQSLIGENVRIHGRKTEVRKLTGPVATQFLNQYHLQGAVSSRYKLGLFLKDELIAVATFSALRKMDYTKQYASAELIRFAVKDGFSVTGGLSKLIKFFVELKAPQDVMSYADMDWSLGQAYVKLGFKYAGKMEPRYYELNEDLSRKLTVNSQPAGRPLVFNTGSLKYILMCNG